MGKIADIKEIRTLLGQNMDEGKPANSLTLAKKIADFFGEQYPDIYAEPLAEWEKELLGGSVMKYALPWTVEINGTAFARFAHQEDAVNFLTNRMDITAPNTRVTIVFDTAR